MASFASSSLLSGRFSKFCGRNFDFGSYCILRTIIDVINLAFLSVFCLFLLSGSVRRHHGTNGRCRVSVVFSVICCALAGITYFSAGFWDLAAMNHEIESLAWLVHFVRGLVWISFTVALLFHGSKWFRIMISVWWILLFLLVSALNVMNIVRSRSVQISEALTWPLHLWLLFCALRDFTRTGFLSKMTFSWINPLLHLGYTKPLTLEDIPSLVPEDEASSAYQKFAQAYDLLRGEKSSSCARNLVFWAVVRVYFKENVVIGICALLRTISVVVSPLLLYAFVEYANRDEENLCHGFVILGCLVLTKVVESLTQRHWFFNSRRCGLKLRSALMVAVYQKQLKLSSLGKRTYSTGEIVNYIAVDAYRMGESSWWFHSMWNFAMQLFLAIGVLFSVVGLGALPGLIPLLICALLNIPFARIIQNCQSRFMNAQDERLRATSEILNSMKVIKLHSWEEKFKNMIETRRAMEFKWLYELQIKKSCGTILYWISPTIISSVVFLGCEFFRSAPLNAGTIFAVLATLRSMSEPVRMIPEALSVMIQVKVSLDRINAFLFADELQNDEIRTIPLHNFDAIVEIQSGNFSWDPETKIPTLIDVNLDVKWGQKVAICGPVGAGKSSFLCSILGEIPKISGTVKVFGNIAYVSQTSWIQSGTIRDNILFGKPMDKARYDKAVNACALAKDITSFDYGDLTEIGQRGLNLSGGQKQRIQLARAVYNDADIYLLDDPFSAVDAHTAAILFNDCVMDALQEKTVILVTHQVEFLSDVDNILVMDGGQVTQSGSYEELLMTGTAFEQLVSAHMEVVTGLVPSNNERQREPQKIDLVHPEKPQGLNDIEQSSEVENSEKGQPGAQLTRKEEMGIGNDGWKPFLDYIRVSKGLALLCLCMMSYAAFVSLQAAATYWLAIAIEVPEISSISLVGVYTGISMVSVVFTYLRTFFAAHLGLKASKAFFGGFTNAIFQAPMPFFDSTPVGRILTRASSDLSILDYDIPFALGYVASCYMEIVATIIVMASVTWQVLIVGILAMVATKYVQVNPALTIFLLLLLYKMNTNNCWDKRFKALDSLEGYYQASATELIRINGTTKAPVMNYAAETSQGVMTVRAFNMTDSFFRNYVKLVDTDASLCFTSNAATEWLLMRIEALQNTTLFTAALLLVLLPKGGVAPGLVGLSLSYALALTGAQVFVTRWHCNLSNYIVSVERIKQFMDVPIEPPAVVKDNRPTSAWPSMGRIELQGLKIKYRPNAPLVLKGITCTIKAGSRVGVVGRTGSGKSTLISALFRLVEPESGKILIDGLDICSIGLKDLRMKLSIIPQEPTLFKGSIRMNLDPLGLYSDNEIWEALEKCQLKTTIRSLPNQLDSSVSEEGENWSAGQRQLFCLGRVLLKRNRILVLDEATASIDSATDAILQRIIRQEFPECTVVTVAHRVPTVLDSDMVMVLSYGKLVEYDDPTKLLDTNSSFSKLVAKYWSSCSWNSCKNLKN